MNQQAPLGLCENGGRSSIYLLLPDEVAVL
jgi:hypothetical protein